MYQTRPGMAAIYVYRRYQMFGSGQNTYVEIDGKPHSHFSDGFMKVDVPPGSYTITTHINEQKRPQWTSHYTVSVDAGEIAILEVDIMRGHTREVYQIANNQAGINTMKYLNYYPGAYQQIEKPQVVDQVKLLKEIQAKTAQDNYEKLIKQAQLAQDKKDYKKAVSLYVKAITSSREFIVGEKSRLTLIELVKSLKYKPEPSKEFKKHTIKAKAYLDLEKFDAAANELISAINLAPWLPEPYYNYALLEEKAGFPSRAKWALQWFIKTGSDPELLARAEESLIRLEILEEDKTSFNKMNGIWVATSNVNAIYKVRVSGDKLTIYAPDNAQLNGTIIGNIIEGYFKSGTHKQDGCQIPGESAKLYSSSISPDRKKMTIKFSYTIYKTQFQNNLFAEQSCISVTPYDKKEISFVLIKKE